MIGATLRAEMLAFECFYGLWSSVGRYVGAALAIASTASWAVISTFLIIEIINLPAAINTIWEKLTLTVAILWFLVDLYYAIFMVYASVVHTPSGETTDGKERLLETGVKAGKRFN